MWKCRWVCRAIPADRARWLQQVSYRQKNEMTFVSYSFWQILSIIRDRSTRSWLRSFLYNYLILSGQCQFRFWCWFLRAMSQAVAKPPLRPPFGECSGGSITITYILLQIEVLICNLYLRKTLLKLENTYYLKENRTSICNQRFLRRKSSQKIHTNMLKVGLLYVIGFWAVTIPLGVAIKL